MVDTMEDKITCPYCFGEFDHTQVHFRMETFFDENQLNDEGYTEIEVNGLPESERKQVLLQQTRQRKPFLRKDDEKYVRFWSQYGGTSERTSGVDRNLSFPVYQLPVLDPGTPEAQEVLKIQSSPTGGRPSAANYLRYSEDGMAIGVEDIFGNRSLRRVCPHCHNPLPVGFGKFPLKFISVIGVTTAGKTVYISQLLKNMKRYAAMVGLTAYFTSSHEEDFIEDNPVEAGKPLPRPTMSSRLSQPMFYDLQKPIGGGKVHTDTIVLYDIAGENCQTGDSMQAYGRFVTKSDGIILLVDPSQLKLTVADRLGEASSSADPELVLNSIHNAFVEQNASQKQQIPVAVCLTKSDTFADALPDQASFDVTVAEDPHTGEKVRKFNATEYNILEPRIRELVGEGSLAVSLQNGFENYNYFAFSATGCLVEKRIVDGEERSFPKAPPTPKRIAEPLLWLFYKFGYIHSDRPIRLPEHRPYPEYGIEIPSRFPFGKPKYRPLNPEEKERYWYEEHC